MRRPTARGTDNAAAAKKGPNGQPLDNPARAVWIDETALSTALNSSYMAEQVALFGIVVGVALLLTGVGFGVLAAASVLRSREAPLGAGSGRFSSREPGMAAPTT